MFVGQFTHAMDEKGRVSFPAAFRKEVKDGGAEPQIILTMTNEGCLWGFTLEGWEQRMLAPFRDKPLLDKRALAFQRIYVANAIITPIDRQGRILITPKLRELAALEKEVLFAGGVEKFEIWSPERWLTVTEQSMALLASDNEPVI